MKCWNCGAEFEAEDLDVDGGVCFIIREFAISQIQEYIEYKITGGDD